MQALLNIRPPILILISAFFVIATIFVGFFANYYFLILFSFIPLILAIRALVLERSEYTLKSGTLIAAIVLKYCAILLATSFLPSAYFALSGSGTKIGLSVQKGIFFIILIGNFFSIPLLITSLLLYSFNKQVKEALVAFPLVIIATFLAFVAVAGY